MLCVGITIASKKKKVGITIESEEQQTSKFGVQLSSPRFALVAKLTSLLHYGSLVVGWMIGDRWLIGTVLGWRRTIPSRKVFGCLVLSSFVCLKSEHVTRAVSLPALSGGSGLVVSSQQPAMIETDFQAPPQQPDPTSRPLFVGCPPG
jgi:hypothetical protein